jgi:hypothetical protein
MVATTLARVSRRAAVVCSKVEVRSRTNRPAIRPPRIPVNMPLAARSRPA